MPKERIEKTITIALRQGRQFVEFSTRIESCYLDTLFGSVRVVMDSETVESFVSALQRAARELEAKDGA